MSDLISRESLKQRINLNYNNHQYISAQAMKDIVNTEPPVEDKTVEELEKIKEEILTQNPKFTIGCEMKMCLEIIDNHISELKGENNG